MKRFLKTFGSVGVAAAVAAVLVGCNRSAEIGPVADAGAKAIRIESAAGKGASSDTTAAPTGTGWGTIKGRILVNGKPAKPDPLVVNKDQFCIAKKPENDSIVIGKDNALVNAGVYLRVAAADPKVAIHPDYEAEFEKPVVLDNNGCMFHPHVFSVRVGQTINVKNLDPVGHNTNMSLFAFNQLIPAGPPVAVKVTQIGPAPMPVQCNIHTWMKAYVLSLDHPYAAITGEDGTFEIKNIPVGEHEFQFWHETGYLKNVAFKGGKTDDKRGRAKLKIAAGETLDLGDIKVPAASIKVAP